MIKKIILTILILLILTLTIGFHLISGVKNRDNLKIIEVNNRVKTIKDLAYNPKKHQIGRIYVLENNEYTPYLVIDGDYKGDCLLLREKVRSENIPLMGKIYENADKTLFYGNSFIDYYLNNRFTKDLSDYVKRNIKEKDIEVYKGSNQNVITIKRKIFLLSGAEVSKERDYYNNKGLDGKPLDFFNNKRYLGSTGRRSMRESSDEKGLSATWTLRTINMMRDNPIGVISANFNKTEERKNFGQVIKNGGECDGGKYREIPAIGSEFLEIENNLRPAFCLDRNIKVIKVKNEDGKEIFAIEKKESERTYSTKGFKTVSDMKTEDPNHINKLYIKEDHNYIPYLVLSNYGNTDDIMVLREKPIIINTPEDSLLYNYLGYKGSFFDVFLENYGNEHLKDLNNKIKKVKIEITKDENKEKIEIERRFFLLSSEEVCGGNEFYLTPLGKEQAYFNKIENRADFSLDPLDYRYLRDYFGAAIPVIKRDGSIACLRDPLNRREAYLNMAFCIDKKTEIVEKNGKNYIK